MADLSKKEALALWGEIEALNIGDPRQHRPLFDVKLRAVHNPNGLRTRLYGIAVYPIPVGDMERPFDGYENRLNRLFQEVLLTERWRGLRTSMVSHPKTGIAYLRIGA